ncbi:MAG: ribonuclease J [Alphaproteobacteria bacterium]|nr:ribonuclease J [Alphaproteobacteria bacterium]
MREVFKKDEFYFVPLGGSEEFGVNFNLYVHNNEFLLIDCGIGFADERYPGIDLLLPDPKFVEANKDKIKGLIITHAHEDHIGAVAYLWERLECPIYTSKFTAAVLRRKLDQQGVDDVSIHVIEPKKPFKLASFTVEPVHVAHSVPEALSLLITTDLGSVIHSGDWNLDQNPVTGDKTDEKRFREIGKGGVLAYIGDSTNANVAGFSGSESDVAKGLSEEFKNHKGRIAITIFSSNIGRIISIARAAQENNRSVILVGRSLHRMVGAARECGYLNDLPDFLEEDALAELAPENIVMIVTGSQGEHRAALAKISRGDHRYARLTAGDTVIFSSRSIPGNERRINTVKNALSAAKVNVVTPSSTEHKIHVSGHPCQGEIQDMLQWLKPHCLIAVHGERLQLDAQAALAKECQVNQSIVPNNGSVIRLAPGQVEVVDHVETGLLAVDQRRIIPSDHQTITARRKLQYSGTVHASLVLDHDLNILGKIKLDNVGLTAQDGAEEALHDDLVDKVNDILDEIPEDYILDEDEIAENIRIALRRYVSDMLGIRPKVSVHVTLLDV